MINSSFDWAISNVECTDEKCMSGNDSPSPVELAEDEPDRVPVESACEDADMGEMKSHEFAEANALHVPVKGLCEAVDMALPMEEKKQHEGLSQLWLSQEEEFEELKRILGILIQNDYSDYFGEPVDWEALDLPNYPVVVETPMDLGTIQV